MTPKLYSMLEGAVISDGSYIKTSVKSALFSMTLTKSKDDLIHLFAKEFDLIDIKYKIFNNKGGKKKSTTTKSGYMNVKDSTTIHTWSYINLLQERLRWYPNGIKIVPGDIDLSDLLTLAVWYMGDGSTYINNHGHLVSRIYTNSFTQLENEWLIKKFNDIYNIHGTISKSNGKPVLMFSRLNAEALVKLIKPFMTPNFSYKIIENTWSPPLCIICGIEINSKQRYIKYCPLHTTPKRAYFRKWLASRKQVKLADELKNANQILF